MLKKGIMVGCVLAILLMLSSASWADETAFIGLSDDGVTWVMQIVTVPDDDYVVINLNGDIVVAWGPEFDEADLPYICDEPKCKCSVHMSMKCTCEKSCLYGLTPQTEKTGTCIP